MRWKPWGCSWTLGISEAKPHMLPWHGAPGRWVSMEGAPGPVCTEPSSSSLFPFLFLLSFSVLALPFLLPTPPFPGLPEGGKPWHGALTLACSPGYSLSSFTKSSPTHHVLLAASAVPGALYTHAFSVLLTAVRRTYCCWSPVRMRKLRPRELKDLPETTCWEEGTLTSPGPSCPSWSSLFSSTRECGYGHPEPTRLSRL